MRNPGASWQALNDGLRMRAVNALALSADGRHLYAGTEGEGVYRLDLDGEPSPTSRLPCPGGLAPLAFMVAFLIRRKQ